MTTEQLLDQLLKDVQQMTPEEKAELQAQLLSDIKKPTDKGRIDDYKIKQSRPSAVTQNRPMKVS